MSDTNEQVDQNSSGASGQVNADVLTLIKKMQDQLSSLERKIDTLLKQSQEKPFREKSFSKPPFRSYGPPRRDREGQDYRPREKSFGRERPSFEKRPFEKRRDDDRQGFAPKKKPFFQKRRER
ncbi:MAG: hypothetical protein NUV91_01000 [Candidatus Omnitrophica bacterium]|nr:hypothetical protein [Candidatus Omnitrophota bacterium]